MPFTRKNLNVLEAIAHVGGLNARLADPKGIFIFREEPNYVANRVLGRTDLVQPQRMAYVGDDDGGGGRDAAGRDAATEDGGGVDSSVDAAMRDTAFDAGGVRPTEALAWEDCEGGGRMLEAGPDDYRDVLSTLMPGDTLRLRAGDYARGLPISLTGEEGRCIVIEGMPGTRPRFLGSNSFNIIAFRGASWIKVRGFDIDGMGLAGFGVASQDADVPVHHIVIEDLEMIGLASDRQITGISTKTPAWDWVIRGNRILEAGTGLYLGNSDGRQPFIRGLIEYNLVADTLGYNMQIKHQIPSGRLGIPGVPDEATTTIRYNVFSKASRGETGGGARPNLLLGTFPDSGSGQNDQYLVYGNFLHENPTEMLFQGEGHVAFYSNVLMNTQGGGINIRPHNGTPNRIDVFFNTVLTSERGISVVGGNSSFDQRVFGNLAYAGSPIRNEGMTMDNVEGAYDDAASALANAGGAVGSDLDLRPTAATAAMGATSPPDFPDADLDFDRQPRGAASVGAYEPGGSGWQLSVTQRPVF